MFLLLTYVSLARAPLSKEELDTLVAVSIHNNKQDSITGMLLFNDGQFMQTLEGVRRRVDDVKQRIVLDWRHRNVNTLSRHAIPERKFAPHAMGFYDLSVLADDAEAARRPRFNCAFDDPTFTSNSGNAQTFILSFRGATGGARG